MCLLLRDPPPVLEIGTHFPDVLYTTNIKLTSGFSAKLITVT